MADPDMATWDACEPQYSQLPFYSSTLRSMVAVGTFFNVDQRIFRVVSHEIKVGEKLNTRVLLNEFVYFKESGITKAPIFLGVGRDHKELVQTRNGFYVYAQDLEAVVFVLRPADLESAQYVGGDGMEDLYVLRYRCDDKEIPKTFVPFPDDSPFYPLIEDSYALEVYKDLGRISDSAATILTRQAESQMMICTGRGQVSIHKRTWAYLKSKLNVEAHPVDLTTFRKRTLSGMKTAGYSQLRKCEYLRLETEADMDNLVKTLGPTSILGNRVKRPKLDIPFAPGTRSIMNQVVGNFERDNWKRRTTNRGFDICSDGDIARMYVRYERHILGSELSVPSPQLQACLQYKLLLVGDEEVEEENREEEEETGGEGAKTKEGKKKRKRGWEKMGVQGAQPPDDKKKSKKLVKRGVQGEQPTDDTKQSLRSWVKRGGSGGTFSCAP